MNVKELVELLDASGEAALYIMLPSGEFVPDYFHITEVGRVQKTFIDCGGTKRETMSCMLQVWTANDIEHRLTADKLVKILKLAQKTIGTERCFDGPRLSDDLPVEIEYGADVASQYKVSVEVTPKGLLFVLTGKQTDCLAPDKCGISRCCC